MHAPLHRRELLAGTFAAAAAASSVPDALASAALRGTQAEPAAAPSGKARFQKALKYGMIQEPSAKTVEERFALVKGLGFDGVELDSPSNLDEDEVVAARDSTGLVVEGLVDSAHWRENMGSADVETRRRARGALEHALRQAVTFGADSVLLVPAIVNESTSYETAWNHSLDELRGVAPMAEELGVRIALENVWNNFLVSPIEARYYLEQVGSPAVGWHFDVGNVLRYGWPEHWVEVLGARHLFKLDVKDYSRKKMNDEGLWKGFEVKIGNGDSGWPRVVAALDAIGFDGWAAAEVRGGDAERLADVSARMDRVLGLA
ncbi:MAG: sugar phosphate isomerase/epimerase family protein [Planctomycetota bacterium]